MTGAPPRQVPHATCRAVITLAIVAVWTFIDPAAARAQDLTCRRPSIEDALVRTDIVVVGTVTATRSNGRVATVVVDDVWKGDPEKVIEVHGGPDDISPPGPFDQTYPTDGRYLFFLTTPEPGGSVTGSSARYDDERCSNTQVWTDDVAFFRPPTAHGVGAPPGTIPPEPEPAARSAAGFLFFLGAALFVAFGILALPVRGGEATEYGELMGRNARFVCRASIVIMIVGGLAWLLTWVT